MIARGLVQLQPVAERQAIDHVHHFEFQAARLTRIAVPQRDDAALLLRIEQDQRAVAADAAAMADDVVPGIIVAAPAVAVPGGRRAARGTCAAGRARSGSRRSGAWIVSSTSASSTSGISPICATIHSDMSLMLLLMPPAAGHPVISVDHRQRPPAGAVRPGPAAVRLSPASETLPLVMPIGSNSSRLTACS